MGENQRALLGKQPVHILMVDFSPPFNIEAVADVCDTIENVFAVASNLSGPSRIPFFSIMVLKNHPELLLPFSYVRNNYQRIQTAIAELRSLLDECDLRENRKASCYYQGLAEACSQYRRQLQSSFQNGICHQLEILIVTCQRSNVVQKQIETAIATLDTENLKRIQVLCLTGTGVLSLDDIGNSQSSGGSDNSSSNNSFTNTGLVEVINLESDTLCLQNFFSGWLVDSSTDSEHMHLLLPPILDSMNLNTATFSTMITKGGYFFNNEYTEVQKNLDIPLTVKCDLHERILQAAQLPFYNQFTVHSDSSVMKMVFPSTSKAMGMSVPVYQLQVTALVPLTAVCDSLVFGMPMIAQPTSCWKIDWDDLEKNQQLFKAFCHTLSIKEQAAVAYMLPHEAAPKSRGSSQSNIQPIGHFVLVPANNGTLLVKSIAVQELLLPYNAGNQEEEEVPQNFLDIVSESLDQVECSESYNPLNYPSNLYESLKNIGRKQATVRQQKRQLDENTPAYTNSMVLTKSSGRQTKKTNVNQPYETQPADTPLGKRLLNKNTGKAFRRSLYTESHNKFLPDDMDIGQSENIQAFKSGRPNNRVKPQLSFPTSL